MLVNKFNQLRKRNDYSFIEFKAEMYRDGKWAVTLTAMGNGLFYSIEMAELITLFASLCGCGHDGGVRDERQIVAEKGTAYYDGRHHGNT